MKVAIRRHIPAIIYNRSFWQVVLAILCLVFFIYFIKNEHLNLGEIQNVLGRARVDYLFLGFCITLVYLALQALLYDYSFRSLDAKLGFWPSMEIFLKRNFVGIFLPASTFTSLAFFNKPLIDRGFTRTQAYYGSYLFAMISIMSVVVVAIPALGYLFVTNGLTRIELLAFIFLILIVVFLIFFLWSVRQHGHFYRYLLRKQPDLALMIEEIREQKINVRYLVIALFFSILIEVTGIAHLYISLLALNAHPTLTASIIGYVIMIIILSASPFLKGIGAIEVSLTVLLMQFGNDTITAASATLLFRIFEFWLPLAASIFVFLVRPGSILLRVLPAFFMVLLGIVNIVSALTPAIGSRVRWLKNFLPVDVLDWSNFAVIILGIALIILSAFLLIGVRNAWIAGLALTTISIIGHLAKAADYEEAILAGFVLFTLIYTRKSYIVKNDLEIQGKTVTKFLYALGGVVLYAITGFYLVNHNHFGTDFSLTESIKAFMRLTFLFDFSELRPHTSFAHGFIASVYVSWAMLIFYLLWIVFRPHHESIETQDDEREEAKALLQKYGRTSLDYFKVYFDKNIFIGNNGQCFLAYKIYYSYAVVLEGPIAASTQDALDLVNEFEAFCKGSNLKAFYYRVSEEDRLVYEGIGKKSILIGQEAIVDISNFSLEGRDKKSIRNAIKKTEGAGFFFRAIEPPVREGLIQKIKQVSDEWLRVMERSEMAFSQGVFVADELKDQKIFTMENEEGRVVAFANLVPDYAREECTYDMIRKSADAPNGVLDALIVNMMTYLHDKGYHYFNMGMAALAGVEEGQDLTSRAIQFAKSNLRNMAHFKGLYEFKNKFEPVWQKKYLIYDYPYDLVQFPYILQKISKID